MLQVFCDFDGTISEEDSLKLLFHHFLPDQWPALQAQMYSKKISEKEALSLALELMPVSPKEACDWILDRVRLDPSFFEFANWCRKQGFDLQILSGGFDIFIHALFERDMIFQQKVISNQLRDAHSWNLRKPSGSRDFCEDFTHCKCASMKQLTRPDASLVYIGDGWTDFCPAKKMEYVFAKKDLKDFMKRSDKKFFEFSNFFDIQKTLEALLTKNQIGSLGLSDESSILIEPLEA